ncbi:hypothetical protein [Piscirickettsia salmonis]|nr:hypothetical protein [Piscirickettsia salmonis]
MQKAKAVVYREDGQYNDLNTQQLNIKNRIAKAEELKHKSVSSIH